MSRIYQLGEIFTQFLCVRDLLLLVLFLKNTVEVGDDMTIDLGCQNHCSKCVKRRLTWSTHNRL